MRKFILFTAILLFFGCSASKGLKTVKYDPWKRGWNFFIDIPRGGEVEKFLGEEVGYLFTYKDGCIIHIGENKSTPNYANIISLGDSISKYRFQNNDLVLEINKKLGKEIMKPLPDTLVLSGIDKDGLYWKDILLTDKRIALGYLNVPKEKKEIFDKSLNSFRYGRKKKKNKSE